MSKSCAAVVEAAYFPLFFKVAEETYVLKVDVNSIDAQFAPSIEKLNVKYTIEPTGFTTKYGKIEVFKNGDAITPIYKDETITRTGADVSYEWDGKANQGASSGMYVGPMDSPYTIKVSTSEQADFSSSCSGTKTTTVVVESIELSISAASVVIMNDPDNQEELTALVKLKKKDGTGVATAVPIYVYYSFSDPGIANTVRDSSYQYAAGKFLGKKDDASAIHWADHASAGSDSTDGYKLVCRGETIVDAGPNRGMTYIWFRPSGVGEDNFKLKAVVKDAAGSELIAKESETLTIWRQVTFSRIFEMAGETHVSANATEVKIQPYFTPAFVDYEVGAANAIPADKSVKYIGLWKNAAPYQEDWATTKTKLPAETPTDAELAAAEGPAGAAYDAARAAITAKAQAWVNRIDTAFLASLTEWTATGGIANDSLVGIKYIHPKYNYYLEGGATNPDTTTAEWPDWVQVTTFSGHYTNRDPDSFWSNNGNIGGLSHGNGIISVTKNNSAAITERNIAHEVGHATKQGPPSGFHREGFGEGMDHSTTEGLMDPSASVPDFTPKEIKILKGIKP